MLNNKIYNKQFFIIKLNGVKTDIIICARFRIHQNIIYFVHSQKALVINFLQLLHEARAISAELRSFRLKYWNFRVYFTGLEFRMCSVVENAKKESQSCLFSNPVEFSCPLFSVLRSTLCQHCVNCLSQSFVAKRLKIACRRLWYIRNTLDYTLSGLQNYETHIEMEVE